MGYAAKDLRLAIAAFSTLAGNLTVLGSVANVIVFETARRDGVEIGFLEYLKAGAPLTRHLPPRLGMADPWLNPPRNRDTFKQPEIRPFPPSLLIEESSSASASRRVLWCFFP